jgi:hypothetical protein
MKLLRENTAGHWNGQGLFGPDPKSTGNKSKTQQMGLHQAKQLLLSKGHNQQGKETTYRNTEHVCKLYICQGAEF